MAKISFLSRWSSEIFGPRALALGIVGGLTMIVSPAAALAAPSICDRVSAASVSSIVGYPVPAAVIATRVLKATAESDGISGTDTTCTFGSQATIPALLKDVTLEEETTSKPLTVQEVESSLSAHANSSLKITVTSYSGLGVPAVYFTETGGGISGEGISGLVGTRSFGASVEQPLTRAKLAALAKLARNL